MAVRTVTHAYNPDATVATSVATDDTGKSLTTCHSPSLPGPAYDADKHPLAVRTFTGTTVCSGGTLQREVLMGYDSRGLLSTMTQKVRGDNAMVTRDQSFTHRADTTVASATHDGGTTNYGRSPAGWTESLTAWRAKVSTRPSARTRLAPPPWPGCRPPPPPPTTPPGWRSAPRPGHS